MPAIRPLKPLARLAATATTLLAIGAPGGVGAEPAPHEPAAAEFFEAKIRPVLAEHCYECHSADTDSPMGELRLDSATAVAQGGASGPAIVPGKPDESLLLKALRYESLEMPPTGKLSDAIIADFQAWIEMGAPDPRVESSPVPSEGAESAAVNPRDHWSLKRPTKPAVPWPTSLVASTEIDAFILKQLSDAGLSPSPPAKPRTLLRRLSYLLTGLSPTADEYAAFEANPTDAAYEQAVDRLLSSPQFGERWGRHWLDIARYADNKGYTFQEDRNYPGAYKYRDWVVAAFNGDMSFDAFVIAQIAADQTGDPAKLPAMGFLTLGRRFLNNPHDIADDRIDVICRGLMGLSVACARCHDHKYDAIPTADYYSLYGVLASSTETPHDDSPPTLVDAPTPVEPYVFLRGNAGNRGPTVTRHFLSCLTEGEPVAFTIGSGRKELAEAIASRNNPLTARVWVNRVWGQLFGRGLVTTPSDFGIRGAAPSHPELLDWLAMTFMDEGWSTKRLIRRIVLSSTFRQASAPRPDAEAADPNNALIVRMNRRRLDLEGMHDGLLAAAGRLDTTVGGPSAPMTTEPFSTRRSIYGYIDRQNLPAYYRTFDFANPNTPAANRPQTASPHQALFLLNSPFALEQSRELAKRGEDADAAARVKNLYRLALGRAPTSEELAEALSFVASGEAGDAAAQIAATPRWQYGWGTHDPLSGRVDFHAFPHFEVDSWRGLAFPDAELGWAMLNVSGGHPGDVNHQVIRRWTAPAAGKVSITGELSHTEAHGDGVHATIVSGSRGRLGDWTAARSASATGVAETQVAAGETIDFVVDCRAENSYDAFLWKTTIRLIREDGGEESWNSHDGIAGPEPAARPRMDRWAQFAQILLMSNEFMFVD